MGRKEAQLEAMRLQNKQKVLEQLQSQADEDVLVDALEIEE